MIPVIIDTDPGVDDALGLLLAGASPELEVLAVTTVGGNVGIERATDNARRLVPIAWREGHRPPIYRGYEGGTETAETVHGKDGLGDATSLRNPDGSPRYPPTESLASGDAADAILRLAESRPREVTLITLGPLSNAAEAVRRSPSGFRLLKQVVIMGGAFREPGNTGPVQEFNIFVDPGAAQTVCEARVPLKWVPLDATHRCLLRREDLDRLPDTPRALCTRDVVAFYMRFHALGYGEMACFLHDPLAVGAVIWPELLRAEPMRVDVETAGRLTTGMTVAYFRPPTARSPFPPNGEICLDVDADEFLRRLLPRLA